MFKLPIWVAKVSKEIHSTALGLFWEKYGVPHFGLFYNLVTPSSTMHSAYFLSIDSCTIGTE